MGVDKPNYTQMPNLLLDDLMPHMGEAELKVTIALSRLTFGYHRERVEISLSDLQEITHLSRQGVINGINAGLERGTIERTDGKRSGFVYSISVNSDQQPTSQRSGLVNEVDQPATSQPNGLPLVNEVDQTSQPSGLDLVNEVDLYTPTLKKEKEKSKESRKKERETRAPARTPAGQVITSTEEPASKTLRVTSRHIDPRHFVDGFVVPGTGTTAVEVYYERFNIRDNDARLNAPKEDDLVRGCPDLDKLRDVIIAYSQESYRPGNVRLILDWYKSGIPNKGKAVAANGSGSGKPSGLDVFKEYARKNGVAI